MEHLKETKRTTNFCWIFSNFNLRPFCYGDLIIEAYSQIKRSGEQYIDFKACSSVKSNQLRCGKPKILFDPLTTLFKRQSNLSLVSKGSQGP